MTGPSHPPVLHALADAHAYYRWLVDGSWVPDYLNRRNLYPQMRPAGLGYAPAGWDRTLAHLRLLGYADATIEAAGLARRTSRGRLVDVFRDRLMVPLTNRDRAVVGFVGRRGPAAGDDVPKYLNSPQTAVFCKREVLYGLGEDAEEIRRGAMPVIVEGPMDRLAVRQGARHLSVVGVAPCGTALTTSHAEALVAAVGLRRPIAVALDPDTGGRTAAVRAWDALTAAGARNLLHVPLPGVHDPAELIRRGWGSVLRAAITSTLPLAAAVADQRIADRGVTPDDHWPRRLAAVREAVRRDLHLVPGHQVAAYVSHLAELLDLDVETVTTVATEAAAAAPPVTGPGSPRPGHHAPRPHLASTVGRPRRGARRA